MTPTSSQNRPWHVYLLTCADGTLYCGVTTDLARRINEHNAGTGAKYTRNRRPVCLAASACFPTQGEALRTEAAVKRRTRDRKLDYLRSLATGADDSRLGFLRCEEYACTQNNPDDSPAQRKQMNDITSYQGKISKEEIGELPLGSWRGETVLVTDEKTALAAVADMRQEKVLGFDTESRPAFRKGKYYLPSLIQVATLETVYIFLINKLPFPDSLKAVFEDPSIIKSGVAVRDDVKDLMKVSHFKPRGFIDLGVVVALDLKLDTHGLRNLAAKFLGIRISKSARCTNWAKPHLTPAQINYAATDAWISRELFLAMDREGLINPEKDLENGNGAPERKASKARARARRNPKTRRPATPTDE